MKSHTQSGCLLWRPTHATPLPHGAVWQQAVASTQNGCPGWLTTCDLPCYGGQKGLHYCLTAQQLWLLNSATCVIVSAGAPSTTTTATHALCMYPSQALFCRKQQTSSNSRPGWQQQQKTASYSLGPAPPPLLDRSPLGKQSSWMLLLLTCEMSAVTD
jgi:hypothetical protein